MNVRKAHPLLKEVRLPQDSFIERAWRHIDAWNGQNALLDVSHHGSSHAIVNTVSVLSSFFFLISI